MNRIHGDKTLPIGSVSLSGDSEACNISVDFKELLDRTRAQNLADQECHLSQTIDW
jgi:hypothetical protein